MNKLWIENIDLVNGQLEDVFKQVTEFAKSKENYSTRVCVIGDGTKGVEMFLERITDHRDGIEDYERMETISCIIVQPGQRLAPRPLNNKKPHRKFIFINP